MLVRITKRKDEVNTSVMMVHLVLMDRLCFDVNIKAFQFNDGFR